MDIDYAKLAAAMLALQETDEASEAKPAAKAKPAAVKRTKAKAKPAAPSFPAFATVATSRGVNRKTGEQETKYAGTWKYAVSGTVTFADGTELPLDATLAGHLIGMVKGDPDADSTRTFETLTQRQVGSLVAYVLAAGGSVDAAFTGETVGKDGKVQPAVASLLISLA